ncbi:hypothetical protein [Iodidimonas sp. SYSU 1G8]|uniref:hypothetical protein n=1 Tax=Iodidimonas sp. SYSU 1G8 TaxID=3133967 RepID=UPI0031FEFFC7
MMMLPSFPEIEDHCAGEAQRAIDRKMIQISPILGEIRRHVQFEGDGSIIFRADQSIGHSPLETVSSEVTSSRMPLHRFRNEELPRIIDEIARQKAEALTKQLFDTVGRATAETGNVVDGGGKPLDEDLLLQILEKLEHTFHPDGTWNPPTMVVSPEIAKRLAESAGPDGLGSKNFQMSLQKIVSRKRDEFRNREANRVLAG